MLPAEDGTPCIPTDDTSTETLIVIIDCHVHIHQYYKDLQDCGGSLLPAADRMGIDKLCVSVLLGGEQPTPEDIVRSNDTVAAAIQRYPDRYVGYCYLNPCYLLQSLDEINRCIVEGPCRGIKLWVAMHSDQPNLDPIADRAAELRVPILQHTWIKTTGNLANEPEPRHLAALAARHPEVNFICGHSGGNWERGLKTVADLPNVYAELAGGDPEMGQTERAVELVGAERVVWGSDADGRSFASQMAKVLGADISDTQKAAILGGNMERLLSR